MYWQRERKITKEDYDAIMSGEKKREDFFSESEIWGYGACPHEPIERDGEYYIPYGISDSCD